MPELTSPVGVETGRFERRNLEADQVLRIRKREETRMTFKCLAHTQAGWYSIPERVLSSYLRTLRLREVKCLPKVVYLVRDRANEVFRLQDSCSVHCTRPLPVFKVPWALHSQEIKYLGLLVFQHIMRKTIVLTIYFERSALLPNKACAAGSLWCSGCYGGLISICGRYRGLWFQPFYIPTSEADYKHKSVKGEKIYSPG